MKLFKKMVSKINKGVVAKISVLSFAMMMVAAPAFAATPNIVTGASNLMKDALTWVLILVPVAAALMIGFHGWMKSMADDPNAISDRNKKMKNVAIGAAIAECTSGLVTVFLGYFA